MNQSNKVTAKTVADMLENMSHDQLQHVVVDLFGKIGLLNCQIKHLTELSNNLAKQNDDLDTFNTELIDRIERLELDEKIIN